MTGGVQAAPGEWPTSGQNLAGQRYSDLTQVNARNVAALREAWVYHMKPADGSGGTRLVTAETVPLVIGGTMFFSTPYGRVVALDPAKGTEKWNFTIPDNDRPSARGVAWWPGDGAQGPAIIFATAAGAALCARCEDRAAQSRLRRKRRRQSQDAGYHDHGHGPALCRGGDPAHLSQPDHHRRRRAGRRNAARALGQCAGLGRAHRQAGLDLPVRAAAGPARP